MLVSYPNYFLVHASLLLWWDASTPQKHVLHRPSQYQNHKRSCLMLCRKRCVVQPQQKGPSFALSKACSFSLFV